MTKQIPLTQGKSVIVDDEDYDFLMQWKWCFGAGGYAVRNEYLGGGRDNQKSKMIYMHCVINKSPDGLITDHIDMDKLNNQRNNLRAATKSQNLMNYKSHKDATSKYKGVCWDRRARKWKAQIFVNNKQKDLGHFTSEESAALAYDDAAKKRSEFSYLNGVV